MKRKLYHCTYLSLLCDAVAFTQYESACGPLKQIL
jgi:hypothetical protein